MTAFTEQARWLVELHNTRADGVQQRAMSLLGLVGVMLTLLLTGLTSDRVAATPLVKVIACISAVVLVAAAWFLFQALRLQKVTTPPARDLHNQWQFYRRGEMSGVVARGSIANSYLGDDPLKNPVVDAMRDAETRAANLKYGLWVLLTGFALLAILIISVTLHLSGR